MEKSNFNIKKYCENSVALGQMHTAMLELSARGYTHITCALREDQTEIVIYRVPRDEIEAVRDIVKPYLGSDCELRKGLLEMRPTPTYYLEFSKEIERNT